MTQYTNPIDRILALQIERRSREASERARPAAEALEAILGRGVTPQALAHRLAITVEDAGMFRSRCDRIDTMAAMLEATAAALRAEVDIRRGI
jgi:hypothetical protein